MTTEREREACELLARECEREGAIWTASVLRNGEEPSKADRIAIRAIIAALTRQEARQEVSPEFTDSARAALAWALFHHQGGISPVGQAIRFALGMGQHEQLPEWRIAEAKQWAAQTGATTAQFHVQQEAQGTVACKRARVVGWWNCDCAECREHAKQNTIATPPAPVDVRAKVEAALRGAKDLQEGVQRVCALLSVQPAGVDDAMVERAHEEYVRVAGDGSYVPVDEVALRAALEAALGGGGGR